MLISKTAAKGKVLQFEQPGEFFLKRGLNKLDENNLIDAVANYRIALKRDPENTEAVLALAEALTEMSRYEESNRLLLVMLEDEQKRPAECYFGMGCNFLAMHEYDHARSALERYLDMEPEGEFIFDAYDMLDALDDEESYLEPLDEAEAYDAAFDGRALLERDEYSAAAEVLEKAVAGQPDDNVIRNNLALAYFCDRKYDKAKRHVDEVLVRDPHNIQAHCNLALYYSVMHDKPGMEMERAELIDAASDDPDDLNKLSLTLMELDEFERANNHLKKLLQQMPYDTGVLHRRAVCAYTLGDHKTALDCYDRLLKIDYRDSVAKYYRGICRAALAGVKKRVLLTTTYQVPPDEMISRIRKLNDYIGMPHDELAAMWEEGGEFEQLVLWGAELPENTVKRAMTGIVSSFGGKKAERFLRDFVLRRNQSKEVRREAFAYLKHMGAKEPYLSYVDGELVESRVSVLAPEHTGDLPHEYDEVIQICLIAMQDERTEDAMVKAAALWGEYVGALKGWPKLSDGQVHAFAAALEYAACNDVGAHVSKTSLCKKYGVSLLRLNSALAKIKNKLEIVPKTDKENE